MKKSRFHISTIFLFTALVLSACADSKDGERTVFKGPGDTADCSALKTDVTTALAAINTCTQNSDCKLTIDLGQFGFCKKFGYNNTKSTAGLTAALQNFADSCESSTSCTANIVKPDNACVSGRCVSNVDNY